MIPGSSTFCSVLWREPDGQEEASRLRGSLIVKRVSLTFDRHEEITLIVDLLSAVHTFHFSFSGGIDGNVILSDLALNVNNGSLQFQSSPASSNCHECTANLICIKLSSFPGTVSSVGGNFTVANINVNVRSDEPDSSSLKVQALDYALAIDRVGGSVIWENISSTFVSRSLSPVGGGGTPHLSNVGIGEFSPSSMFFEIVNSFIINNISVNTYVNNTNTTHHHSSSSSPSLSPSSPSLNQHAIKDLSSIRVLTPKTIRIQNIFCNIDAAVNIYALTAICVQAVSAVAHNSHDETTPPPDVEVLISDVHAKYKSIITNRAGITVVRAVAFSSLAQIASIVVTVANINLELSNSQFLYDGTTRREDSPGMYIFISPLAISNPVWLIFSFKGQGVETSGLTLNTQSSSSSSSPSISCTLNNVIFNTSLPISISHFAITQIDGNEERDRTPLVTLNYNEGSTSVRILNNSRIHTSTLTMAVVLDEKISPLFHYYHYPDSISATAPSSLISSVTLNLMKSQSSSSPSSLSPSPFHVDADSSVSSSASFFFYTVMLSRFRNSVRSLTIDGIPPPSLLSFSFSSKSRSSIDNNTSSIQTGSLYIDRGPVNDELNIHQRSTIFTVKNIKMAQQSPSHQLLENSKVDFSFIRFGVDAGADPNYEMTSMANESKPTILQLHVLANEIDHSLRQCNSTSAFISFDSNVNLSWNITLEHNSLAVSRESTLMRFNNNNNNNNDASRNTTRIGNIFSDDGHVTLHGNRLFVSTASGPNCPTAMLDQNPSLLISSSSSSTSSNTSSDEIGGTFIFECNTFSKPDKELMVNTLLHRLHAHSVIDLCPRITNSSSASFSKSQVESVSVSDNETESHLTPTDSPSASSSNSIISTLSKSYISISKSELTATNSEQVIVVIGLDAEILAATIATAQSVTAVASVLGSAPMAAMSMAKSLSVLQLLGCPRFDPQGRRWSEVDPGFSWTLLPTISFAGGYYHAAIIGFAGLCLFGAIVGLCSKSMPPPPQDPNKKKEPTDKVEEQLYSARSGRFLNFLAMASFPFLGQFFSAAGVVIGNASLATTTDSGAIDYVLGVLPFIFSFPLVYIGYRKLNDAITVRPEIIFKQPVIEISARTGAQDFRLDVVTKYDVVPYYGVRSFIARSLDSIHKSNNDEFSKVKQVKWIQGLLKSSFGRFFLIGHYTWIQDESYFKSVFQECKNEEERQKFRLSHLLLTIPRLFVRVKGPVKETNILGIEEVDAESWRPKLSTFYVLICAVAAMICCFLQGLSKGMDNEESMCRTAICVIAFVSLIMFFLTVYLRPLMVPFFNVLFIILECCGAAIGLAVFILTESYPESFPSSVSNSVTVIQLLAISSATFVGFLLLLIKLLRISLMLSSGLQLVNEEEYWRRNKIENELRFGGEIMMNDDRSNNNNLESFEMGLVSSNTGSREDGNNDEDPLLQFSPTAAAKSSAATPSLSTKKKKRKPIVVVLQKKKIVKVTPNKKFTTTIDHQDI